MTGVAFLFYTPLSDTLASASSDVPSRFPVALSGREFNVDLDHAQFGGVGLFKRSSVPLLRTQADSSSRPGETSINPEDLWRRVAESWHKGAGQRSFDINDADSDPARFYRSQGIDPWTKGQLTLLPYGVQSKIVANNNLYAAVAGDHLYITYGTSIAYTTDVPDLQFSMTWTTITGVPSAASGITSDGKTVYSAHGTSGIYSTGRGDASTSSFVTGTVDGVRYVKGRLFAWAGEKIYNIIATGALPTVMLTHPNADFTWVDVAEGPGFYFLAGYSGDKSLIYRTEVKADGTGLDVPVVAGQLPDGEVVSSIYGYLGFVLVGSNKGIRFGVPDSSGNITFGGLISDVTDVLCFEGQDRFVWFGWSHFTDALAGLGRMDLSSFNGDRPAYASDVMPGGGGLIDDTSVITSVVTFRGQRVFGAAGVGFFAESPSVLADDGWVETGRISYGLFEPKVSMFVTVNHDPLVGSVAVALATDGGDYLTIGSNSQVGSTSTLAPTAQARATSFDLKVTLSAALPNGTAGPEVSRITLRSYPVAARSEQITVPLLLSSDQVDQNGVRFSRAINDDLSFLYQLESSGRLFPFQCGATSDLVVLEDHQWVPHRMAPDSSQFEGTFVASLKVFPQE